MKIQKTEAHCCYEQLEKEIERFMESISHEDAIKMNFLEQSAKYLGVYVSNDPVDFLDDIIIN